MIDDAYLEQVTEKLHPVEAYFNKLKNEFDKLSIMDNISKDVDLNILQQQVSKIWIQQKQIIDRFVELQEEAEKVTSIIQPIHQKVQQVLGMT